MTHVYKLGSIPLSPCNNCKVQYLYILQDPDLNIVFSCDSSSIQSQADGKNFHNLNFSYLEWYFKFHTSVFSYLEWYLKCHTLDFSYLEWYFKFHTPNFSYLEQYYKFCTQNGILTFVPQTFHISNGILNLIPYFQNYCSYN